MQGICILVYKYGMSLDAVLNLTVPQMMILQNQLMRICRAEAGEKDPGEDVPMETREGNAKAWGGVIKMLQEKTGQKAFTFKELMDPVATIRKYAKKVQDG